MAWTNFNNGDTGLSIRTALNTFLTTVDAFLTGNNQYTDVEQAKVANNTLEVANLLAPEATTFTPVAVAPTHVEGTMYYNDTEGTLRIQGPLPGVEVSVGHGMHVHVINNTGAILEKGMAVRHAGVSAGKVQVVKALADTFDNARIFGVVQEEIGIGAEGAIVTQGELPNLNTLGYPTGVPLYLSSLVAGTYSEVAPAILSQVGGSLIQDGANGKIVVSIINNVNLPTVLGGIQGQSIGTDVYSVSAIAQDITNYTLEESAIMDTSLTLGTITLAHNGKYRANQGMSMSFASAITTRTLYVEVYNETLASVAFTFIKNIPRDATEDSLHLGAPFSGIAGHVYKVRVRGTVMDITITGTSFDIESISIV